LNDLLKLRAEKRKEEIGFERQQHVREEQTRIQEKHEMAKKVYRQPALTLEVEEVSRAA